MSWVEIEIVDGVKGQRHYTVSLWFYGESTPRHSGEVTVQAPQGYVIRHR
jgi:hypothetical protein